MVRGKLLLHLKNQFLPEKQGVVRVSARSSKFSRRWAKNPYKDYPYQVSNEEILKKQLQSLTQAIENLSRSKKQKPSLSEEENLQSNYIVVSQLSPRGKLTPRGNEQVAGTRE